MKSWRQGDVLLVEVKKIPNGSKDITPDGRLIFMWGEVTNHCHAINEPKAKARLLDVQAERYLQVLSEVTITHEEHAPIVLREGKYQQAFQVQERGKEVRRVED
jgi:hypothetical protein